MRRLQGDLDTEAASWTIGSEATVTGTIGLSVASHLERRAQWAVARHAAGRAFQGRAPGAHAGPAAPQASRLTCTAVMLASERLLMV